MAADATRPDANASGSGSALSPFRHKAFAVIWTASLVAKALHP